MSKIAGLTPRKRYGKKDRITYVTFELDYERKHFNDVTAPRFAEALEAEGVPISGRNRSYSGGCHKEGMLEEHLTSRAFEASFSKARLKEYRRSLRFPVMDNTPPTDKEMLSVDSKIALLGSKNDMGRIVEAFAKVAKNTDKLA